MYPSWKIVSLLIVVLFLAACTSALEEVQPTLMQQGEISTPTATPKPTLTLPPTQTSTPIPTATSSPWPTKEVLAQFGVFGGDGGWDYYAFIGGNTPKWVLYTDGQLIVQKEDENGVWFEETRLIDTQMCSLLSQIEDAGFFALTVNDSFEPAYPTDHPNPIYNFDNTAQFSEGGSNYVLQVNGPNPRRIVVYRSYVQYLIPEAKQILNLFDNYSPTSQLTEYQAQYLLMRIEIGRGNSVNATPAPVTQTWPAELPSLQMLAKENVETAASAFFAGSLIRQVLIENEHVEPIFDAFGNRLAYQVFRSGDRVYYVAARPFLPHESLHDFSEFPKVKEFALPFSCSN